MSKLKTLCEIKNILSQNKNLKVSLTTGAFDIPHVGHRKYLKKAKGYGEILILILHSDNLISIRKGPARPIRNEDIRIRRISSKPYFFVDYIIIAETQEHVYRIISEIKPSVLVTSHTTKDEANSPQKMDELFSREMEVVTLSAQSNVHSSDIITQRKLKNNTS